MASEDGCITGHRVEIFERGGNTRRAEITDIASVKWDRRRDDISEAVVKVSARNCSRQAETLNALRPGRQEAVIWRGEERVWEGPYTLRQDDDGGLELDAKDVLHYTHRLIMRSGYDNRFPNVSTVTARAALVLTTELTRKDTMEQLVNPDLPSVNVLPYLTVHAMPDEAETSMQTDPYQYLVSEHLRNLAANNGIDFTVLGRAIHLWDTTYGLGKTPVATENDFLGVLKISEYGMELGTYSAVTDGMGAYGDYGGADPYYGLVERLETAYDETSGLTPPTSAEMASQAQRNQKGRNPTPIQVRVPDNSSINPKGVLKLKDLVPGVLVPLRATAGIREIKQMQKLKQVTVVESATGERVQVTLYPAPSDEVVTS